MGQRAFVVAFLLGVLVLGSCGDSDGSGDQNAGQAGTTLASSTTVVPGTVSTSTVSTSTVSSTTAPPTTRADDGIRTIEIALSGGQVVGGQRKETVKLGERVRIRGVSDVAEVVHVHTYDTKLALSPGQPGDLVFEATIPGRFEVEFEGSGTNALTLEVR